MPEHATTVPSSTDSLRTNTNPSTSANLTLQLSHHATTNADFATPSSHTPSPEANLCPSSLTPDPCPLTPPLTPDPSPLTPTLSPKQLTALTLLSTGKSDAAVACVLGLHRTTVTRWRLSHPAFRQELHRRHQEIFSQAAARFRAMLHKSLSVLHEDLQYPQSDYLHRDQAFRAAKTLLSLSRLGHHLPPEPPTEADDR